MTELRHRYLGGAAALILCAAGVSSSRAAAVLLISVDGLKPEYVLEAQARGLKVPYLRSMVAQGTYAQGVIGVWPTVTYPSHTTLVTGVAPAEHGIYTNVEFDPRRQFEEAWYWYGAQIRVPTLWQAAHAKGLVTASIGWPVTVGATGIDYLVPEFWRISGATENLNPSDCYLLAALSLPLGLLEGMPDHIGSALMVNDTTAHGDAQRAKIAMQILREHKPGFMTLHLNSLDAAEHAHGAFSPQADEDLERLDGLLGELAAAARGVDATSIVAVVSDHGFTQVTHHVNLYVPFLNSGLISIAADQDARVPKVIAWKAEPWLSGGMAAVMLHDPGDQDTERKVGELLRALAADASNGIAHIADRAEIARLGGFPQAAYLIVLKSGFYAGAHWSGDLITEITGTHGGHGFSPNEPDMRASLFVTGPGIARHRDLGIIDMRQIGPTLAHLLGVELPASHATPLHIEP